MMAPNISPSSDWSSDWRLYAYMHVWLSPRQLTRKTTVLAIQRFTPNLACYAISALCNQHAMPSTYYAGSMTNISTYEAI